MASIFDLWEKDSFFAAAEEVQESSDRMESVYRKWNHERKNQSNSYELRRELQTALGTAKWQLEEFERAVRMSDGSSSTSAEDGTIARRDQFVAAIGHRISSVEAVLEESAIGDGGMSLRWVCLDEGERDELALFLSCPPPSNENVVSIAPPVEVDRGDGMGECPLKMALHGHRRAVSASADFGMWKSLAVDDEEAQRRSFDGRPDLGPPKVGRVESMANMKWPVNGFRNVKGGDRHQVLVVVDASSSQSHQLNLDINACYERNKSCLDSCGEYTYDKQLYGWIGALHRQLQRSQYQIQYSRPVQVAIWVLLAICFIVLFASRAT
ncbi:Syntaxin-61 [Acorus calamus]|uniref:Syntaxin-61 n=1 Tax=Acorus calamus TaxID=4465 RepID=A0AAV9EX94_ACOCL|nr:Syntaxin-61 [Acorus calamus]